MSLLLVCGCFATRIKRDCSVMSDAQFRIMRQLVNGERLPPVDKRTTAERTALTKYYR